MSRHQDTESGIAPVLVPAHNSDRTQLRTEQENKMSTTTKEVSQADSALVTEYGKIAQNVSTSGFEFLALAQGKSVRVLKDSIKAGAKQYGTLKDISATTAQHFATAQALCDKFPTIGETHTFSKVLGIARKADSGYTAEGAKAEIAKASDLDSFVKALPAQGKGGQKTASEKEGKGTDLANLDPSEFLDYLLTEYAPMLEKEQADKLADALLNTSKLIRKNAIAKASASPKVTVSAGK